MEKTNIIKRKSRRKETGEENVLKNCGKIRSMKYNFRSDGRERNKCIEKRKIMLQVEEKMKTEVVHEKKEGCEMKNKWKIFITKRYIIMIRKRAEVMRNNISDIEEEMK